MYYSKYIKYKNKYLNLKYQAGGIPDATTQKVVGNTSKKSKVVDNTPKESKVVDNTPKESQNFDSYTKFFNITIPPESKTLDLDELTLRHFFLNLVAFKILESNLSILIPFLEQKRDFEIHFYRYTDEDAKVYILCSLLSYYRFLFTLYEHIEFEEVKINKEGVITSVVPDRIYHIIPKPKSVSSKEITLAPNIITSLDKLVEALKLNLFIIIRNNNLALLTAICMYNLFIGTIHVFVIYQNVIQTNFFLLSLFTQYELKQKGIIIPQNIEIFECRLYKQGEKIESILVKDLIRILFKKYKKLKDEGYFKKRLIRGDPNIDNQLLDVIDPKLIENFGKCISIEDIATNTTLFLSPEFADIIAHPDIQEMIKDFNKNKFFLVNTNEKLMSSRIKYIDHAQLWEYSEKELEEEVKKFKKDLLDLEPCHKELLVLKLKEKGYTGDTMQQILDNSVLCYLKDKDKKKRLLYENTVQIDPIDNKFIRNCKFIPEMKKLLNKKDSCDDIEFELHKYRQTILLSFGDVGKYRDNQLYFFAMSWHISNEFNFDKTFDPLAWTFKLNRLLIQCMVWKDTLIFPFRIINIGLTTTLSVTLNLNDPKKPLQEFCGYLNTRFLDYSDGKKNFKESCRDKLYLIYGYKDKKFRDSSGKTYKPYYYTGSSIKFDVSILPYYRTFVCEINWLFYSFIIKFSKIPYFYEYEYLGIKEILVSKFSLDEIYCKYEEKGYKSEIADLAILKQVYYNVNYPSENNYMFSETPLFLTQEEKDSFINKVKDKSRAHSSI